MEKDEDTVEISRDRQEWTLAIESVIRTEDGGRPESVHAARIFHLGAWGDSEEEKAGMASLLGGQVATSQRVEVELGVLGHELVGGGRQGGVECHEDAKLRRPPTSSRHIRQESERASRTSVESRPRSPSPP